MGILKKHRAKLVAGERLYLWWVCPEYDQLYTGELVLHVVSDDKRFAIAYELGQSESRERPFVEVQSGKLPGVEAGCWKRLVCPCWPDDERITPAFVRRLIDWLMDENKEVVLVDWTGKLIEVAGTV